MLMHCDAFGGVRIFQKARRAYSLVELSVAVSVITVGVLGAFAAFSFSLAAVNHSRDVSVGLNLARQIIEDVRTANMPDWASKWPAVPPGDSSGLFDAPSVRRPVNAAPFTDLTANPQFTRNITLQRVSTNPADYRFQQCIITVTVYWTEKGTARSVRLQSLYRQP